MDITLDLSFFYDLLGGIPLEILLPILKYGSWAFAAFIIGKILWVFWLFHIQNKYRKSVNYVLLAVDVPKENEQGPKAVEHIFASLAAGQSSGNFVDRNIKGYTQASFSFEIISLGGYIQFLIRTPEKLRDLIEASIYAQYPDAEINEVEDYTKDTPDAFPNKEYDLWGSELVLYNKEAYPIRTYPAFEDSMVKDAKFKDPMASLLEVLGRMNEGEQVWLQIIITPCKNDWKDKSEGVVKKIIGQKMKEKKTILSEVINSPLYLLEKIGDIIFEREGGKKEEKDSAMSQLSQGEKDVVAAMQNKLSKIGFKCKFRMVYLAKKEFFNKGKAISGVMGSLQQFNTLNMNGFKPDNETKTGVDYWFVKSRVATRQKKIMFNYKFRTTLGAPSYILNTEELATLYHFPVLGVKAPMLKRTEMKRGEAPSILPIFANPLTEVEAEAEKNDKKGEPPTNLPIIE